MRPNDSGGPATPSDAERCRTITAPARVATLATLAREPEGFPYASLVNVAFDDAGRALLLLSSLAEHTANLRADGRASLLVAASAGPAGDDALSGARVTLLGRCQPVGEGLDDVRARYLEAHPYARGYAGFADFAFYRLSPVALRIVAGFGRIANVDAEAYRRAEPDPLAGASAALAARLNAERSSELRTIVRARSSGGGGEPTSVLVAGVDRYGLDLRVGGRAARVAFDEPLASAEAVLAAVEAMASTRD